MQTVLAPIAYGIYLVLILAGGFLAVRSPSLVRALLGLITTLFGVAGMYLLMAAPFLALMQILIYVGAVSVLIFFAIMLTRDPRGEAGREACSGEDRKRVLQASVCGLLPAVVLGGFLWKHRIAALPLKAEVGLDKLGETLTGPYALAFELISVVLVAAMIGAVVLSFERRKSG
uniref:NADH-quinone oxidoreductase subunit J n=1 Tax=Desulfatirhabdium butyrativorans TaxID=340467 RepID=A0A7C4MK67_9BACT